MSKFDEWMKRTGAAMQRKFDKLNGPLITDMNKRQEELMATSVSSPIIRELDVPPPGYSVTSIGSCWTGLMRKFRVENVSPTGQNMCREVLELKDIPRLHSRHKFEGVTLGRCVEVKVHPNPHVENCYFVTANYVGVKGDEAAFDGSKVTVIAESHRHAVEWSRQQGMTPYQMRYVSSAAAMDGIAGRIVILAGANKHPKFEEMLRSAEVVERCGLGTIERSYLV